jgi:stage III sporulation protein AB
MIILLKGEILYGHAPLGEALEAVGRKSEGILSEIFCQVSRRIMEQDGEVFFTIRTEEIEHHRKELLLTEKECQELKAFGEHLGYLDLGMQERTIALYLEQLELSVDFYREHEREQTRLCTSLGLMGGLFLSIMMC